MAPTISVVVPVFGNAVTLAELHRRIQVALAGYWECCELIFVNDASPDASGEVLHAAGADPRVRVLTLEQNVGQNAAVLRGLGAAAGDVAIVLDADLQDPPEAIPRLLERLTLGVDVVFAGRRGAYQRPLRRVTSRVWKTFLHLATGRRLPADAGLFLAMNRTAISHLLDHAEPRPYILGVLGRSGLKMTSIPVARAARPSGSSAYSGWDRLKLAVQGSRSLWIARRTKPNRHRRNAER
jgi:polyisoprenyl-phosphate glycosyltransferase